jgi:hypothetical protein
MKIKTITQKRFKIYANHSKNTYLAPNYHEIGWYSNKTETILGVILFDLSDYDFNAILLGRDENNRFRAIDCIDSFTTKKECELWIKKNQLMKSTKPNTFVVGNNIKSLNIFETATRLKKKPEEINPDFKELQTNPDYKAAKKVITELTTKFYDIDGNFIDQFQSTGFDSRIWELYLNTYFQEEELIIERKYNTPDFLIQTHSQEVAIEAVIVGRSTTEDSDIYKVFNKVYLDEIAIKFSSSLTTKLNKEYWKLDHIKNKPIIFAIAYFDKKNLKPEYYKFLSCYLYGINYEKKNDDIIIKENKTHQKKKWSPRFFWFFLLAKF